MAASLLGSPLFPAAAPRPSFYRTRTALCAAPLLLIFLLLLILPGNSPKRVVDAIYPSGRQGPRAVHNATLGFRKVFAIGLPGRTDKRDALSLAAAYSGVDIEWSEGVAFDNMLSKAVPEAFDDMPSEIPGGAKAAIIGSWRAHMNVLTRIVNEKIESALILEDDVDWDVNFKEQLEEFAKGTTTLQSDIPAGSPDSPRGSPYGTHWDLLWLGHCRAAPNSATQKMYFIHNDTTVPPRGLRTAPWQQRYPPPEVLTNDTRIVFHAATAGCTFAYAVTWQAAQKIVTSLSLIGEGIIYDISVGHMCLGLHIAPFTCYSVYPPLASSHRFAGSAERDSDIRNKHGRVHGERTYDIVYSVIMNLPRLLSGLKDVFSQWPDDTPSHRRLDESYSNQISTEVRILNMAPSPEEQIEDLEDDNGDAEQQDDLWASILKGLQDTG